MDDFDAPSGIFEVASTEMSTDEALLDAVRLADEIEAELASVDRTLTRLEDRTYGRCEFCNEEIAPEILAGDPMATQCGAHFPAFVNETQPLSRN